MDGARVALVHEWIASRAGSEKTFQQMARAFPQADLFALTHDKAHSPQFGSDVATTALQRSSWLRNRRDLALPLMPLAWKMMRPGEYDLVVTSSHAFARYFPTGHAVHLSYVYTPLRYAWLPGVDGRGSSPRLGAARAVLRRLDRRSVSGVHRFAGISSVVCERIGNFYDREADLVYPPVDIEYFSMGAPSEVDDYILGVSRWIPYKRLDLVIDAGERIGCPVVIAGDGPLAPELEHRAMNARVPVTIARRPSDGELRRLYANAAAVVFPAEEDFGIVPVEAQAAGTPVVALKAGGSMDTIRDGITGVLVPEQSASAFAEGLEGALNLGRVDDPDHLAQFDARTFGKRFRRWVLESVSG